MSKKTTPMAQMMERLEKIRADLLAEVTPLDEAIDTLMQLKGRLGDLPKEATIEQRLALMEAQVVNLNLHMFMRMKGDAYRESNDKMRVLEKSIQRRSAKMKSEFAKKMAAYKAEEDKWDAAVHELARSGKAGKA